jgi:hypothetical protein
MWFYVGCYNRCDRARPNKRFGLMLWTMWSAIWSSAAALENLHRLRQAEHQRNASSAISNREERCERISAKRKTEKAEESAPEKEDRRSRRKMLLSWSTLELREDSCSHNDFDSKPWNLACREVPWTNSGRLCRDEHTKKEASVIFLWSVVICSMPDVLAAHENSWRCNGLYHISICINHGLLELYWST